MTRARSSALLLAFLLAGCSTRSAVEPQTSDQDQIREGPQAVAQESSALSRRIVGYSAELGPVGAHQLEAGLPIDECERKHWLLVDHFLNSATVPPAP